MSWRHAWPRRSATSGPRGTARSTRSCSGCSPTGWWRSRRSPGPGPKGRKVYSITPEGFEALRQWVAKPPAGQPVRDELVLKAYAAWVADRGELLAVFSQQAAAHRERLARYEADLRGLETRFGGTPPVTERDFGSYATLRCGRSYERHRIGWCEWMIEQLSSPE